MRPALDPTGHRVPRTKPTCLLHAWRPHRQRPFTLVLNLHQHESSRILHLQYLAKNQSTQCCQSLITQGSDHPPILEPHLVLRLALGPSGLCSRSWATSTYCSSSSAPSSPPSGTSVYLPLARSTRRCKCKIYLMIFNLINYNQQMTTTGCMVDHIHLDKKYIQHTLPKRNNMQLCIQYSFW
jgi:hypothetical protein